MFTNFEKIIEELSHVLAENGEYQYSDNGLTISAKSSDGKVSIEAQYTNAAKQEVRDFKKLIEELDDDLFLEICESLGNDVVLRIQECVNSEDVESVRSAAIRFKTELKNVVNKRIKYYTDILNKVQ